MLSAAQPSPTSKPSSEGTRPCDATMSDLSDATLSARIDAPPGRRPVAQHEAARASCALERPGASAGAEAAAGASETIVAPGAHHRINVVGALWQYVRWRQCTAARTRAAEADALQPCGRRPAADDDDALACVGRGELECCGRDVAQPWQRDRVHTRERRQMQLDQARRGAVNTRRKIAIASFAHGSEERVFALTQRSRPTTRGSVCTTERATMTPGAELLKIAVRSVSIEEFMRSGASPWTWGGGHRTFGVLGVGTLSTP